MSFVEKEDFYSHLNMEYVTEEDQITRAQKESVKIFK